MGWTASDDKTIDQLRYYGLPKNGLIALGNAVWGAARLDPAANRKQFPVVRNCWFNRDDGIRACLRYDEKMSWNELTIDRYLSAKRMLRDGLFQFEHRSSLLGKTAEYLRAHAMRFDEWPKRKVAFIPPTEFGTINKLTFEFADTGKITTMTFGLEYTDDAHRDRLLAGLAAGLGKATKADGTWTYSSKGRTITVVDKRSKRLSVTVK